MINKDQLNFVNGKISDDNWLISRDQIVNQRSLSLNNTKISKHFMKINSFHDNNWIFKYTLRKFL